MNEGNTDNNIAFPDYESYKKRFERKDGNVSDNASQFYPPPGLSQANSGQNPQFHRNPGAYPPPSSFSQTNFGQSPQFYRNPGAYSPPTGFSQANSGQNTQLNRFPAVPPPTGFNNPDFAHNQGIYGNQSFRPAQQFPGSQNNYQTPYPYAGRPLPSQPSFGYQGMPQNNYPYGAPYMPQGQYYPPNPYFRQMPKDYYTLNEIKKSYNRTGLTLLIHSVFVFVLQLILYFSVAISIVSSHSGIDDLFTTSKIETQVVLCAVLSYVLANIGCALIGLGFTKRIREFPRIFKLPQFNVSSALWAFLAVYGIQGIIHILHSLYFGLAKDSQITADTTIAEVNPDVLIIYILYSVVLAPITEEILFRGMVLKNLSVYNQRFAIIISSLLFGIFHGNFPQMITATLLGILLAYVAVKSDSILIPIGLHMFNNLSVEILGYIPESKAKTIFQMILFLGFGTFGLVMFIISMKKSDTPYIFNENYDRIYELEPVNEKKASLASFFSTPGVIIFFVIYFFIIGADILFTLLGVYSYQ